MQDERKQIETFSAEVCKASTENAQDAFLAFQGACSSQGQGGSYRRISFNLRVNIIIDFLKYLSFLISKTFIKNSFI